MIKLSLANKQNTLSKLILLVSIFLIGIISLIVLHLFFLNLLENLDNKTKNQEAKIQIGEYIVNDLYKIRSDFYEIATTATNKRSRDLISNRLKQRVETIKTALDILENGGELKRVIRLNIVGHNNTIRTVKYIKENKSIVSLESIDLRPKLEELINMTNQLKLLLNEAELYRSLENHKEFEKLTKKIKRFYKLTPAFFIRITENTRRLQYEGEITLKKLQNQIKYEKKQYQKLELILIASIIFIVLILTYFIVKQINKNAKTLFDLNTQLEKKMQELKMQEAATRGILDGQPNIVVVSNGEEMIDANSALVDFFNGYNSFDDFKNEHACICDFFQDVEKEDFILDIDYDGLMWYEYILQNPNKLHKVAMKNLSGLHYFSIVAKKKILNDKNFIIIISLNEISKEIKVQEQLAKLNDNLENIVDSKTKQLQELNETLEKKVQEELEKNRAKDKKMIQQSRFAALGEMIGNIAHQWRQPLSAISSTASSMQLQMQLGINKKEDIEKSYESIITYVEFLTQTIEDFRNFFKEDKEKIKFDIQKILNNSLNITAASYKDKNIDVVTNFKEEKNISFGFPNELSQVFLNILSNAKDAFTNKKIKNPQVNINIFKKGSYNIIEIIDNAGGIDIKNIEKVFDPYFTTKHQTQGTGIGLYMSKEIIQKHMNGLLSVENRIINNSNTTYKGACFTISLPKL
ncbi:sensor histidine kinase [Malaciobacter marinus]|uniref:sensor histidine kinase n=1 Tax=Malaciobacter marinus TaxID=505249 RepID=UPI0009A85BEB|nr:HAMP domain-containing sensor histidine kinase [Malaciobacter marinus]SKB35464.1 Histidine kinase-, DNA gyrase B-, and HSP90-like ATPase [Malaciobacter marinus]